MESVSQSVSQAYKWTFRIREDAVQYPQTLHVATSVQHIDLALNEILGPHPSFPSIVDCTKDFFFCCSPGLQQDLFQYGVSLRLVHLAQGTFLRHLRAATARLRLSSKRKHSR